MFQIERDANVIAQETRRGKGNMLITSSDVASALQMAGVWITLLLLITTYKLTILETLLLVHLTDDTECILTHMR